MVVYVVERQSPHYVVAVEPGEEGQEPLTVALMGRPALFILSALEPGQHSLYNAMQTALRIVTPEHHVTVRYRSQRYGGSIRIAEVHDRGPAHPYLYLVCRTEAHQPYDPAEGRPAPTLTRSPATDEPVGLTERLKRWWKSR